MLNKGGITGPHCFGEPPGLSAQKRDKALVDCALREHGETFMTICASIGSMGNMLLPLPGRNTNNWSGGPPFKCWRLMCFLSHLEALYILVVVLEDDLRKLVHLSWSGLGLVWSLVWSWFVLGLVMVWSWTGLGFGLVLLWYALCLGLLWSWPLTFLGLGLVLFWSGLCLGLILDLVLVWSWFVLGLGLVMVWSGHGLVWSLSWSGLSLFLVSSWSCLVLVLDRSWSGLGLEPILVWSWSGLWVGS